MRIEACRACGATELVPIMSLGALPLANALVEPDAASEPDQRFPLDLVVCPSCALVQITETVAPERLFAHYLYFSSCSTTMLHHVEALVDTLVVERALNGASRVVELASNDGYLLQYFQAAGVPVLGCEPAGNVAAEAQARGIPTLRAFFGRDVAAVLHAEGRRADAVLGNNVLAHVPDLPGFAAGVALLLAPRGRAVFEFPYVADLVAGTEFDTIYHEHLCYFSLHAVQALFARAGLVLVDVERQAIHGGSLRVFFTHMEAGVPESPAVAALLREEEVSGLTGEAYYRRFANQVARVRDTLVTELRARKASGQRLAAYGASAKGSTLMNACGIGRDLLDYVVDRSTVKQGRYTPGNHLPILPPEELERRRPDAVLLLTWNFAEEICRQQRPYLDGGGTFLVPVPALRSIP